MAATLHASASEPAPADAPSPIAPVGAGATAVIEALFAGPDGPPPPERVRWVDAELADFLRHAGPRARRLIGVCLFVVRWLAPLVCFRLPPFERRSLSTRTAILAHLERSVLAMALLGLKAALCIIYYEHPDAARENGLDGSCLGERS